MLESARGAGGAFEGALRARWLWTGERLVEGGALRIRGGRIVELLSGIEARALPSAGLVEFPGGLIHPGLVDAHVHLDLSDLAGRVPAGSSFCNWLERVRGARLALDPGALASASARGLEALAASGATAVADFSFDGVSDEPLERSPMRSLLLREAIGLDPARAAAAAEASRRWLAARADGGRRRYGLAPHAPYSAAPALLSACRTLAAGRALAIHVAEDPAERRFTEKGDGPFRDFLERLGVPLDDFRPSGLAPVRYLASLGLLGPETLLIHANDLCGGDVDAIARSGAAVVYCPGTHAFFDRPPHPLPALVAAGVPVGIGTDSAASNAGLSMRAELRLLREQFPSLDAAAVFALGAGAALGRFFPGAGRLAEGGDADIAVVDLGAPASERRPLEAALSAEARDRLTLAGGAVAAAALE